MSEHVVGLNCTNCGAKLDVYDDMERFACGYCGTEMIVQRRGGTVSLKSVTQAIKKIQIGTDKTAAELALVRLNEELKKLTAEEVTRRGKEQVQSIALVTTACTFGILFFFGGLAHDSYRALAVGLFLIGGSILWLIKGPGPSERLATLNKQIAETKSRIEEQLKIVSSAG